MGIDWVSRYQALQLSGRNLINGRVAAGHGEMLNKWSPRDGRLLCQFGASDPNEVDKAVGVARDAFADGRWSKLPIQRRKDVLSRLASLIEAHGEELGLLECVDAGKPISDALSFDVPAAAACIRHNAETVDKCFGKVYAVDHSNLSYELRRPLGVVAGIIGWNFPLLLAATKIGPVLATGNSLVLKPSELTPLSAGRLAELALEAGIPPGVLNVVQGNVQTGNALALHSGIDAVTFTGSSQTGKKLLIAAGQSNMKRLILECGGKSPNIVFDDAPDLEAVANSVVERAFWNQGQVCTASSRLLIQQSVKDQLLPLIVAKAAGLAPADPLKVDTRFGAVISQEHKRKVQSYIENGARDGATLVYRSDEPPPFEAGFYVPRVIFDEVSPEQKIAREEIFGPVLSVMSFRDEDEAISIANNTIYGLSAILWTKDFGRAHRVTHGINAGWVVVNATDKPNSAAGESVVSVGGHKESGVGTEGGIEGLQAYTSQTAVQLFV